MYITEQHIIKKTNKQWKDLDYLCFLSKNVYNQTLYQVRQHYFKTKEYLTYPEVNKLFLKEELESYRKLPAKVSQGSQKLVDREFKSFFALLKLKQKGEYDKPVSIPRYADKIKGRKPVIYQKQALSFVRKGYIKLSKTKIYIKTNKTKEEVKEVRIVPKNGYVIIEIVCKTIEPAEKQDNQRYASIDLGLNNLAAITSNVFKPYIINGKPLKSINQYYNKLIAKEKSKLEKTLGRKTSNKINKIHLKSKNKKEDYLHKSSAYIVNHLVTNNINTLIIGYNQGWKQDINIGKVNNQNFVPIPYARLINMLEYKCRRKGIQVILHEESYTSKSSFIDNEEIKKHETYLGKRIKRGLFRTSRGILINADVNASYNIMKKTLQAKEVWNLNLFRDCIEVCSTPNIITIGFN